MMWGPRTQTVLTDVLAERPGVRFETARAVRVLRGPDRVCGVLAVRPRSGEPRVYECGSVILASGGVGGVFAHSTYPADVVGGSYAMAFHAGAELIDMEFIQFEPLVAYNPKSIRGYVVPTTLFGDGATLRDRKGDRFLLDIRTQGEAGIGKETLVLAMAETARCGGAGPDGEVWLDACGVPEATLESYPWLYPYLRDRGVDLRSEMLSVLPAAHTALGGIAVDQHRKSTVQGLFAAGEAAGGLHGAGRLAGGSGTDVLASGARVGTEAAAAALRPAPGTALEISQAEFRLEACPTRPNPEQSRVLADVRGMMSDRCGIWRNGPDLDHAFEQVKALYETVGLNECPQPGGFSVRLADILLVAGMILDAARWRTESRGAHQRTDHPNSDPGQARSKELGWSGPFARTPHR
jgi:aspartate oxidase